jgi:hypothetical protein
MLANLMNQYLNEDYEVRKSGEPDDLLDLFLFYYAKVNAQAKVAQLTVIKHCRLFGDLPFMHEHLAFLLNNMQTSLNCVYEAEKNKFFLLTKAESRSLSPERREEEEEEKFDATGKTAKEKRRLQQYCYELSKVLDLEGLYLNYFYFNPMDIEKRKRSLISNFLKRNVHIKRLIGVYEHEHRSFRERHKK